MSRVLVLHDALAPGAPPDQLDARVQAEAIVAALVELGHTPRVAEFDLDPAVVGDAEVVVNLVESVGGRGADIHLGAALLEAVGVPFTGASSRALALSTHKVATRHLVARAGLRVAPAWPEPRGTTCSARYIVKPVAEDASVGLDDGCVVAPGDVEAALAERSARFGPCFAEGFVEGREVNVSVLERSGALVVLPPAEIVFDAAVFADRPRIVGYAAKWDDADPRSSGTPRSFVLDGLDVDAIRAVALAAYRALGLRGYGRVDLRVPAEGPPVVIEVNANPCLAPDAGFVAAAQAAGLPFREVVRAILAAAR